MRISSSKQEGLLLTILVLVMLVINNRSHKWASGKAAYLVFGEESKSAKAVAAGFFRTSKQRSRTSPKRTKAQNSQGVLYLITQNSSNNQGTGSVFLSGLLAQLVRA